MPELYCVTWNGRPWRRGLPKKEAYAIAERWQGSHAEHRGMMKHKDYGDYFEVRRDTEMERDFDNRYDEAKRGNPQKIHYQEVVGEGHITGNKEIKHG